MKTIKIKLAIDPTNAAVVNAFNTLLATMGVNESAKVKAYAYTEDNSKEPENRPTKETFYDPEFLKQEETDATQISPAAEEIKPEETKTETIKLEQVRDVLGKKVGEHREAIKAELTKHDAKNVSVLKPEFYASFLAFLNNL